MPRSALPEHLNSEEEIERNFPDDSQFGGTFGKVVKWLNKRTKTWFAFSYRCTESWARWRKVPKVLFKVGGEGAWRFEGEGDERYLSRLQYFKRWHFVVFWPLMFNFHKYDKDFELPKPGFPMPSIKGKGWFGYWSHFDEDRVFWMLISVYLGRNPK